MRSPSDELLAEGVKDILGIELAVGPHPQEPKKSKFSNVDIG